MTVAAEFNTLKYFLINVMEKYPSTRDSDTRLFVQCCKELGAKSLDDIERLGLNVVSIHKTRQMIQNKLGLCRPSEQVKEVRNKRNFEIKDYMSKVRAAN